MGRIYSASVSAVAVTAAQDVFELIPATNKPVRLVEVVIGQYSDAGDAQAELLAVLIKRATSGYTTGSGGSTATSYALDASSEAASQASGATVKANNTTQASANTGTLVTLRSEAANVQGGYQYYPIPSHAPVFKPTEACVVSVTIPADSLTVNATIVYEELN